MFLKILFFLYERTLLPLCTESKHHIFLFCLNTKGSGILFLLLAIKQQILLASEVLMLHTISHVNATFFCLNFSFKIGVLLALLYCFLYSPRGLSPVAYNYSNIFNSQVAFKMRFLSIP